MAQGEDKGPTPQLAPDPFLLDRIFPDAVGLFAAVDGSITSAQRKAIIVLDTNALLVPYAVGASSLSAIEGALSALKAEKRLMIPGQVAREFAKHRPEKLRELHNNLTQRRPAPQSVDAMPLLADMKEFQAIKVVEKEYVEAGARVKAAIDALLKVIEGWYWNDPVSKIYSKLFDKDVILSPEFNSGQIKREFEDSVINKIPPGYKDAGKYENQCGDLVIWKTILQSAAEKKRPCIFVTGEQKPDWWHRSGKTLYPRFELQDAYRRASGGQPFFMMTLASFLQLSGLKQEVVEEVRAEELVRRAPLAIGAFQAHRHEMVSKWIASQNPRSTIEEVPFGLIDYRQVTPEGITVGYVVKVVNDMSVVRSVVDGVVKLLAREIEGGAADHGVIVLAAISPVKSRDILEAVASINLANISFGISEQSRNRLV